MAVAKEKSRDVVERIDEIVQWRCGLLMRRSDVRFLVGDARPTGIGQNLPLVHSLDSGR
jgi:hypothetical protein